MFIAAPSRPTTRRPHRRDHGHPRRRPAHATGQRLGGTGGGDRHREDDREQRPRVEPADHDDQRGHGGGGGDDPVRDGQPGGLHVPAGLHDGLDLLVGVGEEGGEVGAAGMGRLERAQGCSQGVLAVGQAGERIGCHAPEA
jgi:hypothetical protein